MVTIVNLYPEVLGTYGDGGNVEVLRKRLAWRGLASEVHVVRVGEQLPSGTAIVSIGGGEDDAQTQIAAALGPLLEPAVDDGAVVLAVCAGMQLLGHSFQSGAGTVVAGAGLLDLTTTNSGEGQRAIGEVLAQPTALDLPTLTGFANHGGQTELGPGARPLGEVTRGPANHPRVTHEGAVQGRIVGTYLHGPVLARNPALADHLLELATGQSLEPLPDREVTRLRQERLNAG